MTIELIEERDVDAILGADSLRKSVVAGLVGLGLVLLFMVLFFTILFGNLAVAQRLAPPIRPPGPEEDLLVHYHTFVGKRARLVRIAISALFALIAGLGVSDKWQDWLLYTNRVDVGITDPQFGRDVGFYMFQLPFLSFVVSWLFGTLIVTLVVTAISHYINGVKTTQLIDRDKKSRRADGLLALQLHAGPPMTVQFKNIRIKDLPKRDKKKK